VLARNVGLERYPDRVLVLRLQDPGDEAPVPSMARGNGSAVAIGGHLALVRVAQLIEDRCQTFPNTLATVVTPGEMCIFTAQKARTAGH